MRKFELDPQELEELHAKARKKIIEGAMWGNTAAMQAYALMLLADAAMMLAMKQPIVWPNSGGSGGGTIYGGGDRGAPPNT